MRSLVLPAALLLSLFASDVPAGAAVRAEAPVPIYYKLKTFRSYLALRKVDRYAHRFMMWFSHIEPIFLEGAGNTVEEIEKLTQADLPGWSGLFGVPPSHVDPVPPAMQPLAEAFKRKICQLYPGVDVNKILISYRGNLRMLLVEEVIPMAPSADPNHRAARRSQINLSQVHGTEKLEAYGISMYGGLTSLCFDVFPHYCDCLLNYVDYRYPPKVEGSSLLFAATKFGHADDTNKEAWKNLEKRILETADQLAAGTYVNPIDQLLAAQGETVLPEDFNSYFDCQLSSRAVLAGRKEDLDEEIGFRFPMREAYQAPVTKTYHSPVTGATFDMTVDLKLGTLSLKATNSAGYSHTVNGTIPKDDGKHGIIVDGSSVAIRGGYGSVEFEEDYPYFALPGHGQFERIEVRLGRSIKTAHVFVPLEPTTEHLPVHERSADGSLRMLELNSR